MKFGYARASTEDHRPAQFARASRTLVTRGGNRSKTRGDLNYGASRETSSHILGWSPKGRISNHWLE